jgi:hypothetical protein
VAGWLWKLKLIEPGPLSDMVTVPGLHVPAEMAWPIVIVDAVAEVRLSSPVQLEFASP